MHHVSQAMLGGASEKLGETRLKADSQGGLHDLTDALVGQHKAHPAEDENAEDIKDLHEHHLVTAGVTPNKSCMGDGVSKIFNSNIDSRLLAVN